MLGILGTVLFTAWNYQVTILEFTAALTSLIAVYLGTTGRRVMWPWWIASSALYALWFFDAKYYGSFATQFIFIAFGIWGWLSWRRTGAEPATLSLKGRAIAVGAFALSWIAFAPYLKSIGAVAIWSDTFGLLGSLVAQVIMVKEKWESWVLWFAVDIVLTIQYFRGGAYFTSLVYLVFTAIAILGWSRWLSRYRNAQRALR
jgi:nicotinamide mononucleotide transporter